jgi:hypothetical protein
VEHLLAYIHRDQMEEKSNGKRAQKERNRRARRTQVTANAGSPRKAERESGAQKVPPTTTDWQARDRGEKEETRETIEGGSDAVRAEICDSSDLATRDMHPAHPSVEPQDCPTVLDDIKDSFIREVEMLKKSNKLDLNSDKSENLERQQARIIGVDLKCMYDIDRRLKPKPRKPQKSKPNSIGRRVRMDNRIHVVP